jgi:hypothetical protein
MQGILDAFAVVFRRVFDVFDKEVKAKDAQE